MRTSHICNIESNALSAENGAATIKRMLQNLQWKYSDAKETYTKLKFGLS